MNFAKQRGRLYFWQYQPRVKHYPGWQLSADKEGCLSTIEICNELSTRPGSYRTLKVTPPNPKVIQLPHEQGRPTPHWYPERVKLESTNEIGETATFELDRAGRAVTFRLDTPSLNALRELFNDILRQRDDYKARIAGEEVWLWCGLE